MKSRNDDMGAWRQSAIDSTMMEMSGNLAFVSTKNKFVALKKQSANKVAFTFEEDPVSPDGQNLLALFLDAIFLIFNDEDDDFVESKINLYNASNGNHAFGISASQHIYFLAPIKASDTDNRIAAMTFWREPISIFD